MVEGGSYDGTGVASEGVDVTGIFDVPDGDGVVWERGRRERG